MWYLDKWSLAVIINLSEEFRVAANKFEPSITTLFQKEKDLLCYSDDINQSPSIPATLQMHKFVWSSTAERDAIIDYWLPFKWKRTLPYSVTFRKEMWLRGEGVWIFNIVSVALRLLYEKVLWGKWSWRLVKISNVSPVVSWKVLQTVAILWFGGQ